MQLDCVMNALYTETYTPTEVADCLHDDYDTCVGNGTLYRHDGTWHMHGCLEQPMWIRMPLPWEICGLRRQEK